MIPPNVPKTPKKLFISIMSGVLIGVLVMSLVLPAVSFMLGSDNKKQIEEVDSVEPIGYMDANGVWHNHAPIDVVDPLDAVRNALRDGLEMDADGNVKVGASEYPLDTIPGSLLLEELQPKFKLNLTDWFMDLEDAALMYNRTDMDVFVVNVMNIFYNRLSEVYTLEELDYLPEVLDLEDYLWERLGVSEVEIEGIRARFPEILAQLESVNAEKELRIERNVDLLLSNVIELREDFKNSYHLELFDLVVTFSGLSEAEMTELVEIIIEVIGFHRSETRDDIEGYMSGSLLREKVVETTVEGLWNSRSPMAFMALDREYQPLLSLLVELVVAQVEQLVEAGE